MRRNQSPIATVVKVLLVLLAVDLVVRGPFLDSQVGPTAARSQQLLRDRTRAQAWSRIFTTLERAPRADVRIGLFGDSTVYQTSRPGDVYSIAFLLRRALQQRFPTRTIQVVDCSQIGLYASDTALLLNRALGHDIDLFVYGVTLRSLPRDPPTMWATTLGSEIGARELARLLAVGAGGWLLDTFPLEDLAAGLVHGGWTTYAYRLELRTRIWEEIVAPAVAPWPALATALAPAPLYSRPPPEQPRTLASYRWTREAYGPPNHNWQALDVVGRLCERYGSERCLLYSGPLNPDASEWFVPPDLYEDYRTRLRALAKRYDLDLRDFTKLMPAMSFRARKGGPDAIHLNVGGGTLLAQWLAAGLEERVQRHLDEAATDSQP